ncbi:hypothetical protein NDU88_009452 [Pleurodeles waltl]|uniref:Uncharacterized protein n=1 Tax=Pleurodeles waltl TaxID=8319 RepID=A0AAV7PV80_PLEWA|nr:hypothetical protein NDU88_009452 [Pleurodeles waltl]
MAWAGPSRWCPGKAFFFGHLTDAEGEAITGCRLGGAETQKSELKSSAGLAALRLVAVDCLRRSWERPGINTFLVVVRAGPLQQEGGAVSARLPDAARKDLVPVVLGRRPRACVSAAVQAAIQRLLDEMHQRAVGPRQGTGRQRASLPSLPIVKSAGAAEKTTMSRQLR